MENITIGEMGPGWRPYPTANYFAQRGSEGEYSFGSSPADALANLEKREAEKLKLIDEELAEDIAFMALGASEYFEKGPISFGLDGFGGFMGYIAEVIKFAPLMRERERTMDWENFRGVWPYDIAQCFGYMLAEVVIGASDESPASILESLIAAEMLDRST